MRFTPEYKNLSNRSIIRFIFPDKREVIDYQFEMLKNNRIEPLLGCEVLTVDREIRLSYDITSLVALKKILERKDIGRKDFIEYLCQVCDAFGKLEKHLLDYGGIILDSEYIYGSPSDNRLYFIYIPDKDMKQNINEPLRDFIMNLVIREMHFRNENADDYIQRMIGVLKAPDFSLEALKTYLDDLDRNERATIEIAVPVAKLETVRKSDADKPARNAVKSQTAPGIAITQMKSAKQDSAGIIIPQMKPGKKDSAGIAIPQIKSGKENSARIAIPQIKSGKQDSARIAIPHLKLQDSPGDHGMTELTKMKKKKVYPLKSYLILGIEVIALIALFAVMVVKGSFRPGNPDTLTTLVGLLLVGGAVTYLVWTKAFAADKKVEKVYATKIKIPSPAEVKTERPANPPALQEHPSEKAEYVNKAIRQPGNTEGPESYALAAPSKVGQGLVQDKTVLLSEKNITMPAIKRLGANQETVAIKCWPFRVGRLEEQVDYRIMNPAVGKLHAELIKKPEGFFIADMNTRNGTFVNGERVEANSERQIRNGDKIAMANEEFIFFE